MSFNRFEDTPGHATLWSLASDRAPVDLNIFLPVDMAEAGWTLTRATEINDSGLIIGDAYNSRLDLQHAFVLSPVPEPETYALLLVGLGMICFLRYRRGSGYSFR
ncbi:PEP-CTERM sorting domain-containing protein [Nitrosospira multiformis]|uniref:PEP-CTERM sorting domain-containing protein n=1 Tax=Nitrosospira multiformis TaxID=1231 RepID=UPI001160388D|nr:PEP-CTERM sorting domain-containing protein [Nitrosospira multiformis]